MNQYRWEGVDKSEKRVRGIVVAVSSAEVIAILRKVSIEPEPDSVVALSEEEVAKMEELDQIDETFYLHCEQCDKKIGAVLVMKSVFCSECGTENLVPRALRDAKRAELKEIEEYENALYGRRGG